MLHPAVQKWIRAQGWSALREVQEQSVTHIVNDLRDLLIAATTAAGKTEAAFLPLMGPLTQNRKPGVSILYVAPLKALINDQYKRLSDLCDTMEIPVTRWHGDAPQGPKTKLLKSPSGIVLITPESIEAMFVRRAAAVETLFGNLDAIIIDELHAFLQGPRGLHLSSLLNRIEALNGKRPRRIGLSATIGDLEFAANWMSSGAIKPAHIISIAGSRTPIKLQVRGYIDPPRAAKIDDMGSSEQNDAVSQIAQHAFKTLRGSNNLFFAGSRKNVEILADQLRQESENAHLPNEFFPHHGSLSKELREELELRLKEDKFPTTAIATTTLELGIDIGSVHSVAQYGPPRSLSSLIQRLGRSGRREGTSAIFRNYIRERHVAADADPLDMLRLPTIQACAAIRLLFDKFIEPPEHDPAIYSVAVHQILSLITSQGGLNARSLYRQLCDQGPFSEISQRDFAILLRGMADDERPLLEQSSDGIIMLGPLGEILTGGRDFYANFTSSEEWRIVHQGRTLGSLPLINAFGAGHIIGFAGRRWRVTSVDDRAKVVEVTVHPAGRVPQFEGMSNESIHDRLANEMLAVFMNDETPAFLDQTAAELLEQGRAAFHQQQLHKNRFFAAGADTHILTWRGSAINAVLAILLISTGMRCETFDVGVTVIDVPREDIRGVLAAIGTCPSMTELSQYIDNLVVEKYDEYVSETLLRENWARRNNHLQTQITDLIITLSS